MLNLVIESKMNVIMDGLKTIIKGKVSCERLNGGYSIHVKYYHIIERRFYYVIADETILNNTIDCITDDLFNQMTNDIMCSLFNNVGE